MRRGSPTDDHCVLKESVVHDIINSNLIQQDAMAAKCAEINQPGFRELKGRACRGTSSNPRYRGMDHCKWENETCSIDTSSSSWNSLEAAMSSEIMEKKTKCDSANELLMRQLPGRKCRGNATLDPEWIDVDYCEVSNEPGYPWPPSAPGQTGPAETQPDLIPGQTGPPETQPGFIPGQTGPSETQPGFIPGQTGPASTYDPKAWCMEHTQRKLDAGLIDINTFWNYYRACQSEY